MRVAPTTYLTGGDWKVSRRGYSACYLRTAGRRLQKAASRQQASVALLRALRVQEASAVPQVEVQLQAAEEQPVQAAGQPLREAVAAVQN